MAKYFSTARPPKVERYDHKSILIHYNVAEAEQNGEKGFEFESVRVPELSKGAIVEAIIRERYTLNDEIALLRQRTSKKAEFAEYNEYAEAAKATADAILAG